MIDEKDLTSEMSVEQEEQATSIHEIELHKKQEEITQLQDKLTRLYAEFDNYQKRVDKQQAFMTDQIRASILKDLLPLVDNVNRALEQKTQETKAVFEGIEMVRAALMQVLLKYGITEFESYDVFDPEFHEALTQIPSPDHTSGQIVQVFERGFMIGGKVLRPAKVVVAQ